MSAKWIKTKISALASDMTDGPFGSDLKMVHYTDKREARIVQLSNVGEDGWLDENIKYTSFSHAHEIGRCIIEPGNIIIAKMMPAGRAILCPNHEPMFVQGSDVVKIVPNDRINSTFFVYMTKQNDYLKQIEKNTQGSTRARTSISKLKEITLTIPEAKETQNKLAQILSTCDTVIQNTQKTIDKYKAIKQGMMQDLFTRGLTKDGKLRPSYKEAPELYKESELGMIPKEWNIFQLGDCCSLVTDGSHFSPEETTNGFFMPSVKDMTDNGFDYSDCKKISEESYNKLVLNGCKPNVDDVLIAKDGSMLKYIFSIKTEEPIVILSSIAILRLKTNTLFPDFLVQLLRKSDFAESIIAQFKTGTGVPRIVLNNFKKVGIFVPSRINEQIEIAKRLSSIDSTIQKEEAVLEKYKNIKIGLMARLLTPPDDAEIIDETGE